MLLSDINKHPFDSRIRFRDEGFITYEYHIISKK